MSDKLRAAAQAEPEPLAWMVYTMDGKSVFVTDCPTDIQKDQRALPLYTAPPRREWVGLTDEEVNSIYETIEKVVGDHWENGGTKLMFPVTLYEALEAKLREKNND